MKTFQILNDALIYSVITSEQYIKLEKKNFPLDWSRYRPPIKLSRKDLLRYYIMLMETDIYRSEIDLKIYNATLINACYPDEDDDQPQASCNLFAS